MKPINKCDCHECCLVLAPNTHIEVFTSCAVDRSMIKRRCEPAKPLQWRPFVNNIMYPAHLLVKIDACLAHTLRVTGLAFGQWF